MKNEAMYEAEENEAAELSHDTMDEAGDQSNWLSNGYWPLREQENVVVLVKDSFLTAVVEQCFPNQAEIRLMKSVTVRGKPTLSHWADDATAVSIAPRVNFRNETNI